jgi:hypothetical protein
MKKIYLPVIFLFSSIIISWTKNDSINQKIFECNPIGVYTGESKSSKGQASPMTYDLRDNNLAIGMTNPTGNAVTFGGYKSTCDSVFISVCYTGNMSYYLLKGKFSEDKTVLTGTYQNKVTPSDKGTFELNKL